MRHALTRSMLAAALVVGLAAPAVAQEQPPPAPAPAPAPAPEPVPVAPAPEPDPYEPEAPAPAARPTPAPGAVVDPGEEQARTAATVARERARVAAIAAAELQRARERLAQVAVRRDAALAELAAAQAEHAALVDQHGAATVAADRARRDLGNFARLAYTSGPSEWTLIETFLSADNPSDAMRRATLSSLVAQRQDAQWDEAVDAVARLAAQERSAGGRITAAQAAVTAVEAEYRVAKQQVDDIETAAAGGFLTATEGVMAVQRACGDVEIPQCRPSGWGEGNLTRDAVWLMRVVKQRWPAIRDVGGYRPVDPYPDHPSGRAIDVMVPDGGRSAAGAALGDEIAEYFMQHADEYGVMYLIWKQRIWRVDRDPVAPVSQWRMMGDRGDWTSNHYDHVHVTLSTGVSGSDMHAVVGAARAAGAR